ncbi:MAG TPA: VWA domain-containing protein [Thiotrichales bacterium]|nr:VWA domain-containing protein [Thiotrichales bacterium]
MIQFLWPWAFAVLPLPWLVRRLLPAASEDNEAALRVPYLDDFQLGAAAADKSGKRRWPLLLYTLAWLLLVIAAARPQWTGNAIELPVSGRDLLLAIDLSKSMEQPIRYNLRSVSRIAATKAVVGQFIEHRVGDRIGLILFGEQAYVQAPLTFDRATVNTLLQEAVTGLAGNATAIGDAIGLAVKRLNQGDRQQEQNRSPADSPGDTPGEFTENNDKDHPYNDRVLILVTDGVSNAGEISPIKAAELAARKGLKIHTIGIGNRGTRELDERTLKAIARITGGRYFRAHNTDELVQIYQVLDQLEPVEKDTRSYRPTRALFYIPLAAALGVATLLALLQTVGSLPSLRLKR